MKKILFILITALFSTFPAHAESIQAERFNQWLDMIEKPISESDKADDAAEALAESSSVRVAAFNLQALARLYQDLAEEFGEMKNDFKEIEDVLGNIDKWTSLKNKGKLETAKKEWKKIVSKKWFKNSKSPRLKDIRKFLDKFDWPNSKEDKNFLVGQLLKELKHVGETEYQFEFLEEGNGLHEFRRALRWFLIEARALNGVVQFEEGTTCPIRQYAGLLRDPIAKSKYSQLAENPAEKNPCKITRCLFLAQVKTVDDIGQLKDKAEKAIGNKDTDKVPRLIRVEAENIYEEFKKHESIPALAAELDSCISD